MRYRHTLVVHIIRFQTSLCERVLPNNLLESTPRCIGTEKFCSLRRDRERGHRRLTIKIIIKKKLPKELGIK